MPNPLTPTHIVGNNPLAVLNHTDGCGSPTKHTGEHRRASGFFCVRITPQLRLFYGWPWWGAFGLPVPVCRSSTPHHVPAAPIVEGWKQVPKTYWRTRLNAYPLAPLRPFPCFTFCVWPV